MLLLYRVILLFESSRYLRHVDFFLNGAEKVIVSTIAKLHIQGIIESIQVYVFIYFLFLEVF